MNFLFLAIVHYKLVIVLTKETNDVSRKEVVDVTVKQNFVITVQIYDVMQR